MRKTFLEQDGNLPPDELPNHSGQLVCESGEDGPRALPTLNGFANFSKHALRRLLSVAHFWSLSGNPESSIPGTDQPGIFFDSRQSRPSVALPATVPVRRRTVAEEKTRNDSFHDSEFDIFDLFNACNGIVRDDGLLDIRELDELSLAEAEALNVVRLKEIWVHTAAGCSTCEEIIRILNSVRGTLKADADDHLEQIDVVDTNLSDSIP